MLQVKRKQGRDDDGNFDDGNSKFKNVRADETLRDRSIRRDGRRGARQVYRAKFGDVSEASVDDANDTDSVTSASSYTSPPKSGISPLNRRRSVRLAMKRDATAIMTPASRSSLRGHNTITMATKPNIQRMTTSTRWRSWRNKADLNREETVVETKKRNKAQLIQENVQTPDFEDATQEVLDSDEVDYNRPLRLLSKQTTTSGLQSALRRTRLGGCSQQPDHCSENTNMGQRMKRKASTLTSPVSDRLTRKGALKRVNTTGRDCSKHVTIVEEVTSEVPRLKRRATRLREKTDSTKHKTKKIKPSSLSRLDSSIGGQGSVYVPPRDQWPLLIMAQVVWQVPLRNSNGESINGLGLHVDPTQCLLGLDDGSVIQLDASVTPVRLLKAPSGVKCMQPDAHFLYVGCNDGSLYEMNMTDGESKLILHPENFGQIFALDFNLPSVFCTKLVALSDQHGHLVTIAEDGAPCWIQKSDGEFGWMVFVDDTGVYHGHSKGVTKYTRHGGQIWNTRTLDPVLQGVKSGDYIYCACGSAVVKFDIYTGKVLYQYTNGKPHTGGVHAVAAGSGMVFAGGNKIVVYEESTGSVIYIIKTFIKPVLLKYFDGRLFCLGKGMLTNIDFSKENIQKAQTGINLQAVEVNPYPAAAGSPD